VHEYKQLWADSPYLEPVRASFETGKPIEWIRVHDLPDYVYFNQQHSCEQRRRLSTCHGQVDQCRLVYEAFDLADEMVFSAVTGRLRSLYD